MIRRACLPLLLALIAGLTPWTTQAQDALVDVATTLDATPTPGFEFKEFRSPVVSDHADSTVAFFAKVRSTADDGLTKECLWALNAAGQGRAVVCRGDSTPPGVGGKYQGFLDVSITPQGEVAWIATLSAGRQ